ncbi:MAG: flagellar motor switch protein FliG [Proteobacteria bacterium]|nr:flagellar motor switch protein FliG [Pseudomonadota bacterium]
MANQNRFSPADKAAILLVALGEDIASDLFKVMEQHEIRTIVAAINRLGKLDQVTIDTVLDEFLGILNGPKQNRHRDPSGFAQRTLQLAFKGEQGQKLAQQIGKSAVKMRSVELTDPDSLARVLVLEHPQTIAMVIAHCTAGKASQVLRPMPEALRTEILLRIAKLESVDPDLIAEIDQHLLNEIDKMGSLHQRKIGGAKKVADILNRMDKKALELLETIESRNPELSQEIRQAMFTFDELVYLDQPGLQLLIQTIPRPVLTLALRGVNESLQQLFFKNMSQRAGNLLRDDIEALGAQKQSEVQKAQREILDLVQKLEAEGKLLIERKQQHVG